MTLTSAELGELRRSLHDFLSRFRPVQGARDASAEAQARVWLGLSDQLGLAGIGIPEEYGGLGEDLGTRRMVLEELGRALVPAPVLSTFAVARAIIASGDPFLAAQHLPEFAAGRRAGAFSLACAVDARQDDANRWRLFGEVRHVVDLVGGGLVLLLGVSSADHGAVRAFLLDTGSTSVPATPVDSADPTRPLTSLALDGAVATALGGVDERRAVALIAQDLAFEQLGGARWCLETTRDYAKLRSQFGRSIGSFQSIKHMLADVVLENEAAWSAATGLQDELDGSATMEVHLGSVVHTVASEAYLRAAGTAVQVHGAIAITDETDVHLHFKRATTSRQMLGGMSCHYHRVLDCALASRSVEAQRSPWSRWSSPPDAL